MARNIVEKVFAAHLVSGELKPRKMVGLKVDQVLTVDINSMTWLEFEAIGLDKIKVPLVISYVVSIRKFEFPDGNTWIPG